jgi:acetylornithine deacetylase/succinyl-diaminopimelate desuccinylase family protein
MSNSLSSEAKILRAIDDDEALDLLSRLVSAPSANPQGKEAAAAEALASTLARADVPYTLENVYEGRPNLSARVGPAGGTTLLLNGHTDTMPPGDGWTSDPYFPTIRDGKLYGLGSCDMKAGLAAMTEAVIAAQRSGIDLNGCVVLDAVVDEEATGAGTKHTISRGRRATFAIIAEPTELQVLRLGNGQVNFTVRLFGMAGHGSTPEAGHNAIYDAAELVSRLEAQGAKFAEHPHSLVGPASYNVGRIEGGLQTSIIPAECVLGVDRRISPGGTVAKAIADLDALLEATAAARPGMRVERTIDIEYEPFEVAEDVCGCQILGGAVAEVTGREIPFGGLRATTDAVFLAQAGTPTVIFGPGSIEQAHRPDEYVPVEQLHQASRAFALMIARFLS